MAHGGHLHIGLEGLGIGVGPAFQLRGPGQGADDVDVDVVLALLGGGHAGQTADAFLGGGVGALAEVAEETGAGGEVDDRALGVVDEDMNIASIMELKMCDIDIF